jgi:nitrate/nitrite transport system permease protein
MSMSVATMNTDFGLEKAVDRKSLGAALPAVAAEPAKELKMEKVATLPAGEIGTPFSEKLANLGRAVLPPVLGILILLGIWYVATMKGGSIPGPIKTWDAATVLFADPFYRNGPNDQGIGWNILSSLQRVGIGFGFAALVGIPLGFVLGRSATYTIFICSIWPMIMNTAQGVQRVPQDYLNVARVLALSEWKVVTKILFPAVLPYMLTGIRLSIGTAWLVIVAAEMLTGGVGIGFWVWDEWNNLKVEHIIIAIFVIGIVGLILEQALILLARKLTKESA